MRSFRRWRGGPGGGEDRPSCSRPSMTPGDAERRVAVVYGSPAGSGGLGLQVASAVTALARGDGRVHALGPGRAEVWGLEEEPAAEWHVAPEVVPRWLSLYTPYRWRAGRRQLLYDTRMGRWAAGQVARLRPARCYAFTGVALETLRWARSAGVPAVLDSPNGHIAAFARVYRREARRWCGGAWHGHPAPGAVARIEKEYALADRIRVSSAWAKGSLVAGGVPAEKVRVIAQPVNLRRFRPPAARPPASGPLRVCYVGTLDQRKGFVYLLEAARKVGADRVELEIVGSTGDRCSRAILERHGAGVVRGCAPGDPLPAYHRAELFVLPSLEEGFGFVAAEAMACGLPVVATDQCGAAEWVQPGRTGWIVPAGDADALTHALEEALRIRPDLPEMGRHAREEAERHSASALTSLRDWFYGRGD